MSSRGLEALRRITLKDFIFNDDSCLKDIKLIETELKRLESISARLDETQDRLWEKQKIIDKQDEVLQIIKEKCNITFEIKTILGQEFHCVSLSCDINKTTMYVGKEEYDLLKEVLL